MLTFSGNVVLGSRRNHFVQFETHYGFLELEIYANLKGVLHFSKKLLLIIYSPPCHPRCPCLSFFSRKQIEVFDENIPGFSPYNGLQWEPNSSRSKNLHFFSTEERKTWTSWMTWG